MKALVLEEYEHLVYRDVPEPVIGPQEVLVQVKACGICGSDVHGWDGSTGRRIPPVIMGHEASGIIAEVGPAVAGWQVGDRVTFDSTIYCGHCYYCRRGLINLCDNRRVLGVSCDDYRQKRRVCVRRRPTAYPLLPANLSFVQATLVEPVSIAFHGTSLAKITLDDTTVVVGVGMVGLFVVQALRAAGCGQVIAVDVDPDRLELACKLGADMGLRSDTQDVAAEVARLSAVAAPTWPSRWCGITDRQDGHFFATQGRLTGPGRQPCAADRIPVASGRYPAGRPVRLMRLLR